MRGRSRTAADRRGPPRLNRDAPRNRLVDAYEGCGAREPPIAIVDTGVDTHHPDLKDHMVAGYDFVGHDSDPEDDNGHGTQVAGIAAAVTDNGVGIAGGAPQAEIMPIRVLSRAGTGDRETIASGIVWAAQHGANVINLVATAGTRGSRTSAPRAVAAPGTDILSTLPTYRTPMGGRRENGWALWWAGC